MLWVMDTLEMAGRNHEQEARHDHAMPVTAPAPSWHILCYAEVRGYGLGLRVGVTGYNGGIFYL